MRYKPSNVSSKYGAPIGRRKYKPSGAQKVYLNRVYLNSGGYDSGGAYFGLGKPLYIAHNDETEVYTRADNRADAKRALLALYPQLSFYR